MRLDEAPFPPSEILQQFADGALAHMESRSVTRFETTLREMRAYHRLLLNLYGNVDGDGRVDSYALLEDVTGPVHRSWMAPYRPLISRAVSKLAQDSEYFQSVVYLSYGLLNSDRPLAPRIVRDILGLGPMTVFRLEAWLTRRAAAAGVEKSLDRGVKLIGTDRSAYEDALMSLVSAWEASARTVNTHNDIGDLPLDEAALWKTFQTQWPGVKAHLESTATMFVIAAWNQDVAGVERFADLLLRWQANLRLDGDTSALALPWLINTDVMALDWLEAQAAISSFLHPDPWSSLSPLGLFTSVTANLHAQTVLLASAVALNWGLTGKSGAFAGEAAQRLLQNRLIETDGAIDYEGHRPTGFIERLKTLLSIELAGPRYQDQGHGAALDQLLRGLDNISERKVTTGRVYTPSTLHGREDLTSALDLVLLSSVRWGSAQAGLNIVTELVGDDASPDAAEARRILIDRFMRLRETTEAATEATFLAIQNLDNDVAAVDAVREGRTLADQVIAHLDEQQSRSIVEAPIAETRVAVFEDQVHQRLVSPSGGIPLFTGYTVGLSTDPVIPDRSLEFSGFRKTEFLDPPIEIQSSNYFEVYGGIVAENLIRPLWSAFLELEMQNARLQSGPDTVRFWRTIKARAAKHKEPMVLLLSREAYALFARRFLQSPKAERPLDIVHRRGGDRATYRQTVEGVEVHEADLGDSAGAYFFRADLLRDVTYRVMENGKVVVAVTKAEARDKRGVRVKFRYAPRYAWRPDPVIRFRLPWTP